MTILNNVFKGLPLVAEVRVKCWGYGQKQEERIL